MKKNVKQLRELSDLSQGDIGRIIGKAHNSVNGYESGRVKIPLKIRDAYAGCFGVGVDDIDWNPNLSQAECEVNVTGARAAGDFSLLTADELVGILVGRINRLSQVNGKERAALAGAVAKIASELERRDKE